MTNKKAPAKDVEAEAKARADAEVAAQAEAEAKAKADAEAAAQAEAEATTKKPGLRIEAISEQGRYRAGHRFTREASVLALADLSDAQINALKTDPMLKVQEVTL